MDTTLSSPILWYRIISYFICAPWDDLKLIPLFIIALTHSNQIRLIEVIALTIGDISLVFVTSLSEENPIYLVVGLFHFLLFVLTRTVIETQSYRIIRWWPIVIMLWTGNLVVTLFPINDLLFRGYVFALAGLIGVVYGQSENPKKLGYTLYLISDLLLLISLNHRFVLDWMIVRVLYWTGLDLIYHTLA